MKIQLNYQINGEQGESVDNNEFLMNFQVAFQIKRRDRFSTTSGGLPPDDTSSRQVA